MTDTPPYSDGYWQSPDGLKLHYRDYPGSADRPPIICIPGLTRNARDYAALAERLSGTWRVICVDLRGRGESEHAQDPATYNPLVYAHDVEALLTELSLDRIVCFGTSLGGLVSMLLAMAKPGRVAGVLLNDVGPVVESAGLDRIKAYVGRFQSWLTWVHAARGLQESQGHVYPDYDLVDWIAMAKRLNRLTSQGRVVPDYDMKIAEPIRDPAPGAGDVDLWPAWDAFGDAPSLVVRGALSDILSAETAREMVKRRPSAKLVTVSNVGHAPSLDEPQAMKAIDALLKSIAL
jgi:pimeloyl-ACP methyl ester carboxylesterase